MNFEKQYSILILILASVIYLMLAIREQCGRIRHVATQSNEVSGSNNLLVAMQQRLEDVPVKSRSIAPDSLLQYVGSLLPTAWSDEQ